MKRAPRSRQRHDLYAKYHDYDSEISDLLGECGLKRAEYAGRLKRDCGWVPSRKWSCEAPPETEIAQFGGFETNQAFGHRVSSVC